MTIYSPPDLHFLVIDFSYSCGVHLCTFTCTTDTPCHLTLHLTDQRPIIRRVPTMKRGAQFTLSSVTCFVEIYTAEQIEPGDTLEHSWAIPFPLYDHTYYWYLTGTQATIPCVSISQIFWHSCPTPPGPQPYCECTVTDSYGFTPYNCYDASSAFIPLTPYRCTSFDIKVIHNLPKPQCHDGRAWIFYADPNGRPTSILAGPYIFAIPDLPLYQSLVINIPISPVLLSPPTPYAIAWGTRDWTIGEWWAGMPCIGMIGGLNPTCTPIPNSFYYRIFDRIKDKPCGGLVTDWTNLGVAHFLYYKTYGLPP